MLKWFNNLKIGKKLSVGFSVVVLVLVILSTIVFVNLTNYITANVWNVHTYKVLANLDGIVTSMINMETGQRGFSITGDEKFLEPYNKGKAEFEEKFNEVKELTSDNPKQQANLDKIKQLKEEWQQVAESSINLRREVISKNKVMDDVIREESAAKGKAFMDNLRSIVSESVNMENALLEERGSKQRNLESSTKMLLIIGTIIAILLAIFIAYYVSKKITSGIEKVSYAAKKLATKPSLNDIEHVSVSISVLTPIGIIALFIPCPKSSHLIVGMLYLNDNLVSISFNIGDISSE